jgi:hypothetical protein
VDPDSIVGIVTHCGLDGPGIESWWGDIFCTGPVAHPASCTMGSGSVPRLKQLGCGVDHLPPSSAKVEGGVELYISSPSGPMWPILG